MTDKESLIRDLEQLVEVLDGQIETIRKHIDELRREVSHDRSSTAVLLDRLKALLPDLSEEQLAKLRPKEGFSSSPGAGPTKPKRA